MVLFSVDEGVERKASALRWLLRAAVVVWIRRKIRSRFSPPLRMKFAETLLDDIASEGMHTGNRPAALD